MDNHSHIYESDVKKQKKKNKKQKQQVKGFIGIHLEIILT